MTNFPDDMARAVNKLLNRYLVRGADGAERPIPYSPIDYQAIRFLADNPLSRATDVAQHLGVPATTMQSALDRLKGRKLLSKQPSSSDKRARLYKLTKKGVEIHTAIENQDRANMADILAPLSLRDQETLVRLMKQISE